jgi:hypothetical protein
LIKDINLLTDKFKYLSNFNFSFNKKKTLYKKSTNKDNYNYYKYNNHYKNYYNYNNNNYNNHLYNLLLKLYL